jgi:2-polyprenyl-3-methyl-5-hydroxy-6-metoxy-1,4-benzoquinol methylase
MLCIQILTLGLKLGVVFGVAMGKRISLKSSLLALFLALFAVCIVTQNVKAQDSKKRAGLNAYQILTGEDPDDLGNQWDALYKNRGDVYIYGKEPARFLVESLPLLPERGLVLDIAMAEGRNGVFMAQKGYDVEGVDISELAIRKAKRLAKEHKVKIKTIIADLSHYKIQPERYDIILCLYYLDRQLIESIKKGLKPGGVVVFENHTLENLKYNKAEPREYLLQDGELKSLFADFQILKYREKDTGKQAIASLVARKPSKP